MKNFFIINENLVLNLKCVEAIQKNEEGVFVYVKSGLRFASNLPFETLKTMVDLNDIKEEIKEEEEKKEKSSIDPTKQFISL